MKELKRQWDNPLFKSCNNDAEWKNLAKSLLEIREEIYNLYPQYKVNSNQVWMSKVNRYLAYCVDGGLLNSHFTLKQFISLKMERSEDTVLKQEFDNEISALLDFRLPVGIQRKSEKLRDCLSQSISTKKPEEIFGKSNFNTNVMVALIESEYIRQELNRSGGKDGEYPKFLQVVLSSSQKIRVKEACCIQIIKFFANKEIYEDKAQNNAGVEGDGAIDKKISQYEDEDEKASFVKLVQPLISTMEN